MPRRMNLPTYSRTDKVFLTTLMVAEGYVYDAPNRVNGEFKGSLPRISIGMHERAYPSKAAALMGTKVVDARVRVHKTEWATRWSASAQGVRALLVMARIWSEFLEGSRTRRFRSWMISAAVPHALRVSEGIPRVRARVERDVGVSWPTILGELRFWLEQNRALPIEPWRFADRIGYERTGGRSLRNHAQS